jgi:Flp pilus assembly protein TadG
MARLRDERGMVTAETAVVLPVLLLVLAGAVAAVTVVGAQMRCVDAAREAARAAARGEPVDAGDDVRVTVTARITPLGPLPLRIRVHATAVAQREPGSVPP